MPPAHLKQLPFHTFLLPLFFVLHALNQYFRLIPATLTVEYLLYYVLLAAGLLLSGKWLFKTWAKGGVWTTGALIIFFFFGALHDFIKSTPILRFIASYKILLPLLLIVFIAFSLIIKRSRQIQKTAQYFTYLFLLLTAIEGLQIAGKLLTSRQAQTYATNNPPVTAAITGPAKNQPDIFFIVFDEYASSVGLQQYLGFNNSQLDSTLLANHFYIVHNSKSNYNSTPLSLASTLNLQYFNAPLENEFTDAHTMLKGWYSLKMSHLPQLLANAGYTIYNYGLCDLDKYPVHTSRYFNDYENGTMYKETIWGCIQKDILWNINTLHLPFLIKKNLAARKATQTNFIARNRQHLQLLLQALQTQNNQPKFVFCHIMMPHSPFYFDKEGVPNQLYTNDTYDTRNNRGLYLEQLQYTNTWIDSIVQAASQPFTRPRVVIIEGDHGYRENEPNTPRNMNFMNLNAWYFSDGQYQYLNDSISPVNSFRVILNKYFNNQLPLLKDSTVLLR
ncbi:MULTISPECIES: sulfatase-like hydrolase/transferase [Niastella]|uniref:Sulfatase-like hydrolase/transferase n=1 Tax=Niastella soli TaxID=2821487 RepID=A0ABS3Z1B8_9BACT|nr:sulfatase-like hydrolase/transferase [Niastella soli]MBO9203961.1 sulfatase-like hydrolase/transferase [Niastella soli]